MLTALDIESVTNKLKSLPIKNLKRMDARVTDTQVIQNVLNGFGIVATSTEAFLFWQSVSDQLDENWLSIELCGLSMINRFLHG